MQPVANGGARHLDVSERLGEAEDEEDEGSEEGKEDKENQENK